MEPPTEEESVRKLNISLHAYIDSHRIDVYIEACPPCPTEPISFESIRDGTNVLHRDYRYVSTTTRNKLAFVSRVRETLAGHGPLPAREYHQLIELICPDFPLDVVQNAHRAVALLRSVDLAGEQEGLRAADSEVVPSSNTRRAGMLGSNLKVDNGLGSRRDSVNDLVLPEDFLYAFAVCLYYADFFSASKEALAIVVRTFLSGFAGFAEGNQQETASNLCQKYLDALVSIDNWQYQQSFRRIDMPPDQVHCAAARSAFQIFVSAEYSGGDTALVGIPSHAQRLAAETDAQEPPQEDTDHKSALATKASEPILVPDCHLQEMVRIVADRLIIEIAGSSDVRDIVDC